MKTINLNDNNDFRYTNSNNSDELINELFKRVEPIYNKYLNDKYSDVTSPLTKEILKNYLISSDYNFELNCSIEESLVHDEILTKDFDKVGFDFENFYINKHTFEECGLITLSNGLSVILTKAGGDWEIPVYFAVYFDGINLRAYIPAKGNLYNANNMLPLGNDEQEDEQFLKEQGLTMSDFNNLEYDLNLLTQDITEHIRLI